MIPAPVTQPVADCGSMRRARPGCVAISVGAAPAGVFLMPRRRRLTRDATARALLPDAAVGCRVAGLSPGSMTIGGRVAGVAKSLLPGSVARATAPGKDARLAAVDLIPHALGIRIVSARASNLDLMQALSGTALAPDDAAPILLGSLASLPAFTLARGGRAVRVRAVRRGAEAPGTGNRTGNRSPLRPGSRRPVVRAENPGCTKTPPAASRRRSAGKPKSNEGENAMSDASEAAHAGPPAQAQDGCRRRRARMEARAIPERAEAAILAHQARIPARDAETARHREQVPRGDAHAAAPPADEHARRARDHAAGAQRHETLPAALRALHPHFEE